MLTRLEAVNTMLMVIGQAPVKSIPDQGISDSTQASKVLDEYTRELQSSGYDFNSFSSVEYTPNSNGNIALPDSIIRADTARESSCKDVVVKVSQGSKFLYDKENNTFVFNGSIHLDVIERVDFENLPYTLQRYVVIRAARVFSNRVVGAQEINGYTQEDEARARAEWLTEVSQDENLNVFNYNGFLGSTYHPVGVLNRNAY